MQVRNIVSAVGAVLLGASMAAFAADGGGDMAGLREAIGTESQGWMELGLQLLAAVVILGVAYVIWAVFMKSRRDGEFAVVVVPLLVGGALLLILAFLFDGAGTEIGQIGGGGE